MPGAAELPAVLAATMRNLVNGLNESPSALTCTHAHANIINNVEMYLAIFMDSRS